MVAGGPHSQPPAAPQGASQEIKYSLPLHLLWVSPLVGSSLKPEGREPGPCDPQSQPGAHTLTLRPYHREAHAGSALTHLSHGRHWILAPCSLLSALLLLPDTPFLQGRGSPTPNLTPKGEELFRASSSSKVLGKVSEWPGPGHTPGPEPALCLVGKRKIVLGSGHPGALRQRRGWQLLGEESCRLKAGM